MALILDGKKIAADIKNEVKEKTAELLNSKGIKPGLALLLVGDDDASKIYVSSKEKACLALGFLSIVKRLPANTSQAEVLEIVNEWNSSPQVHGILVQLPLPKHIDENKVIQAISPQKDVDGFHPENFGRLVIGLPGFVPCTPAGIMELFKRYEISLKGKHVVVLGRSNIVGKPIANLLYQKNDSANAVVTICHTACKDFSQFTKQADVLIAAIGVPNAIKAEHIKDGAVIIDVGINRVEDKNSEKGYYICGDVDYNSVLPKVSAITPVPGGVGQLTPAMLMLNTYKSAAGEVF